MAKKSKRGGVLPDLDSVGWKDFYIADFSIRTTQSGIDKNKLLFKLDADIPYVTRSEINNGVNMFVSKEQNSKYKIDRGNVITIGLDTQTVFYQPHSFYTGQNIQVLESPRLNKYIALFIASMLKVQMQKFNWGGNGATLGRLNRTKIMLPVGAGGNPNYDFMEQYGEQIMLGKYQKYLTYIDSKN